jgi:hypothetical protein
MAWSKLNFAHRELVLSLFKIHLEIDIVCEDWHNRHVYARTYFADERNIY